MAIKRRLRPEDRINRPESEVRESSYNRQIPQALKLSDESNDISPKEKMAFSNVLAKVKENKRNASAIKVEQNKTKPKVDEGTFLAITTDAELEKNQSSTYGTNDRIRVRFHIFRSENDTEGVEIATTCWKSNSTKSRYYQILSQLLQEDPGTEFELSSLIGVTCEVTIEHVDGNNGVFSNISEVKYKE